MAKSQRILRHATRFTDEPAPPIRVTPATRAHLTRHRAAPSTARCHTRSFAHANYLGSNLRDQAGWFDPKRTTVNNDVDTL